MIGAGCNQEPAATAAPRSNDWLTVLEHELRCRTGWADELISPFARARRRTKAKPTRHLTRADTLLFPPGQRQSA